MNLRRLCALHGVMFSAFSGVSMEIDSRKLYTLDDYRNALADTTAPRPAARFNLRAFFDGRQSYLMNHAEVKKVGLQ